MSPFFLPNLGAAAPDEWPPLPDYAFLTYGAEQYMRCPMYLKAGEAPEAYNPRIGL